MCRRLLLKCSDEKFIVDVQLRDVDVTGSVLWNGVTFKENRQHRRGVVIPVTHIIFSTYHSDVVTRGFPSRLHSYTHQPLLCAQIIF